MLPEQSQGPHELMLYEIRMLVLLSCGFLFMLEYSEISPDILQPSETFPWKMKTSTCVCKKRSYKMYSQMAGDFHVLLVLETNVHVLELKISDSNSPDNISRREALWLLSLFLLFRRIPIYNPLPQALRNREGLTGIYVLPRSPIYRRYNRNPPPNFGRNHAILCRNTGICHRKH